MANNVRVNVVDVRNGLRLFRAGGRGAESYRIEEQDREKTSPVLRTSFTPAATSSRTRGLTQMNFSATKERV